MKKTATAVVAAMLTGCASPPNTPGAGVGKDYTPIIDLRGVDGGRYLNDLDGCRNSAGMIDAQRQELMGLIGGALIGAAYGASISNNRQVIGAGANSGALSGSLHAGANARTRQAVVMGNCMASRGYRVIDGTATIAYTVPLQQSPAPQPITGQPVAWSPPEPQAAPAPVSQQATSTDSIVRLPTPAANPPAKPTGTDSYVAERVARDAKCNATGLATLVAKGPGYESYSMQCMNGDVMMIRCEMGNCRALK